MVSLSFVLVVVVAIGYANGLDCWGSTCTADQYCEIRIHENTGNCYTHHGHGHHEDHQSCIGAHHPGGHCFCKDKACVDQMIAEISSQSTVGSNGPVVADTTVSMPDTTSVTGSNRSSPAFGPKIRRSKSKIYCTTEQSEIGSQIRSQNHMQYRE